MLTVGHIVAAFGHYTPTGQEAAVERVVVDSRQADHGSLFAAFVGEQTDGHDYVATAFARGAAVALVERPLAEYPMVDSQRPPAILPTTPFCLLVPNSEKALQQIARYWRRHFKVQVIGITGSVGKTSTKEAVAGVWQQRFATLKSAGNHNNEIGLPLTILNLRPHHTHAVLEMGMYAKGEIALLCDIAQPQIGLVTLIGPVHLSRLGTMEAIVEAKRELVEALPASGVAILNADDARVMSMAGHTAARVFTYGLTPTADLWADDIHSRGLDGVQFRLHHAGQTWRVRLPLLGRHNVHTALAAAAAGVAEEMAWEDIIRGLQTSPAQLRLVTAAGPRQSILIDDTYNASPDSVLAALNLLAELDGRKVAVLGDMLELGTAEEEGHRTVGRRAATVADQLVAVGPRGRLIGEEARAAGLPADRVQIVPDTDTAVALLRELIQPHDYVLIKGSLGAQLNRIVKQLVMNNE